LRKERNAEESCRFSQALVRSHDLRFAGDASRGRQRLPGMGGDCESHGWLLPRARDLFRFSARKLVTAPIFPGLTRLGGEAD
jgi:hypothetical protein